LFRKKQRGSRKNFYFRPGGLYEIDLERGGWDESDRLFSGIAEPFLERTVKLSRGRWFEMEVEMIVLRFQALVTQREIAVNKLSKIDDSILEAVNAYVDSIPDLDLQKKIYPEFMRWISKSSRA